MECEASLHGSHPQGRVICFDGEPNVTLLYDASYFGHAHLVQYLLHQKGDPDVDVKPLRLVSADLVQEQTEI